MTDDERLQQLIDNAERAYDRLHEAHEETGITACFSDAKESLLEAIALAKAMGLTEKISWLQGRLDHIKAVFHSQCG